MQLVGTAALVTGAGRRLGQAIAVGLARAGCDVAVHYHASRAGADETARAVTQAGRRAVVVRADLRDPSAAQEVAPQAATLLDGRLDIVVCSAAVMVRQPVTDVTPASWDATMDLNLRGAFFTAQGAIPWLRRARGKIVFLADVAAFEPWRNYLPHCVSKAGVVMLTKTLALALAPEVAVNAVAPGPVLVPDEWDGQARDRVARSTPLARLGHPDDVVAAVRFLLADSDYVTGSVVTVDGGRRIR